MENCVPKHVAIMMDGNGRWGKQRGLTRSEGHYAGAKAMEKVIDASIEMGIGALTLYAFSSENWSRPLEEVNYLMHLPVKFFKQKLPEFQRRNIVVRISGNLDALPKRTKTALMEAVYETENNTGLIVNFAFNYGGRGDILQAVRQILQKLQDEELNFTQVNEQVIQQCLYTKGLPDPELVIRTGGEKRMSNFLLWQSSNAQLYFTDTYFPDFNGALLEKAVRFYQGKQTEVFV
ncbi:polyprenyl diphosphate synthase [Oceanobacillus kapialis]|uniref:Isoprenyl transferase n=1 Tax=Oceanobacillus kapialis TaxID=481353 RepID=A0ABW5Q4Z3_9BACI